MATSVIDQSAAVKLMLPDWQLAKALLGGTRTMREAGETYLPAWPKEASEAYTQRLASAVLFPAYQRTVQTLSAKPFSKPITFGEDIPTRFAIGFPMPLSMVITRSGLRSAASSATSGDSP